MPQNLAMDPVKKDYVVVNGSPVDSDSVEDASYFALTLPQGKYLNGTPDQGSLLYTLENAKRSDDIEQRFAGYAIDAINRQVVANGQASSVSVNNMQITRTGTVNNIEVVPSNVQLSSQLNFVPVGS